MILGVGTGGQLRSDFGKAIEMLKGRPCWSFIAGSGTGSVVALDIGAKLARASARKNPHLTAEQNAYEGEFQLLVSCAWRLDSSEPNTVVCGSADSNRQGDRMLSGLGELVGKRVVSVDVAEPALDLRLELEGGLRFAIFCDETNEEEGLDNYLFFTRDKVYAVGARGSVDVEERLC